MEESGLLLTQTGRVERKEGEDSDGEIWKLVIEYLGFLELCHLSRVNKSLRNLCIGKIRNWEKTVAENVDILADKNLIEIADQKLRFNDETNQHQLTSLILKTVCFNSIFPCKTFNIKQESNFGILKNFNWSPLIFHITPAANFLTSATFSKVYCSRESLILFLKSSSNLTTLMLSKISIDKHIFVETDIFHNCPKLQFLTIEFCSEILFETIHSPMITRIIPNSIGTSLITYQKSEIKESEFHENWKFIDKILSYCIYPKFKKAFQNYHLDLYFLISQCILVFTIVHFVIHSLCKFLQVQGFYEFLIFHALFLIFLILFCSIMSNIVFITVFLHPIHRNLCKFSRKFCNLKPWKRKFLANFPMAVYLAYLVGFACLGKLLDNNVGISIILGIYCFVCFFVNWFLIACWI